MTAASQQVKLGALELKNPVLAASGCFGYGLEYQDFFDISRLGGLCTKGLSLQPQGGNPPERTCETPAGMLNAIGLANIGVEAFCSEKLPLLRERGATVVANIFGHQIDDFVRLAERLDGEAGLAAIELNVSCPNYGAAGLEFGKDARLCAELTSQVRRTTKLPLWVKLSPEAPDVLELGRACEDAGADAISAINTVRGMAIDVQAQRPRLQNRWGGLSGPALRPIALRIVWDLYGVVSIPIIGCGGVSSARDALEFILAGASAVQVGTANFCDPCASLRIAEELRAYCEQRGVSARDLVGRARRDDAG